MNVYEITSERYNVHFIFEYNYINMSNQFDTVRKQKNETSGKDVASKRRYRQTIITSVDFTSAAAISPTSTAFRVLYPPYVELLTL